ncbi:hypothetical protein OL239_06905 [Arthrobacter sp. ATA002]|uniref:hypothetical protein n=1 Tax=Arthrobacter sp. ATA002 TaxID=2991715 RepID=UPI0022A70147|nr:hypothetical protein [Arthrobacter sp. ATA002]WAP52875.1 hypothetical protein OL239_06905 [Arthrobacter sp. ATA002]
MPASASASPAPPGRGVPAVGRAAALDDGGTEDPREYLGGLILEPHAASADPRPAILAAAGPDLLARLQAHGPVVALLPGAATVQVRRGAPRLLVIDRRTLDSGLWAHAETGAGSVLFRELAELIRQCQDLHIATVFVDSGEPDRFYTSTLRKLCRNVLPLAAEDLNPEGTAGSALLMELQDWSAAEVSHVR